MKVALVLTGLMRCWEQAYPVFKTLFMDRYDTDVYIHTWSEVGYYTGKGYLPEENGFVKTVPGERGFHASGELIDANKIIQTYHPISITVDDFTRLEPAFETRAEHFKKAYTRPKNTIAQSYKALMGVQSLVSNGYDIIIRARPDIVLENDPGQLHPYMFYTLPSKNKVGKGTGDSILIGPAPAVVSFYQTHHSHLEVFYDRLGVSCPHMFIEETLKPYSHVWQEMQCGAHVAHSPNGIYQEP